MTPSESDSSGSAKAATGELRPLPRTPREAFWMLEDACDYLRDYYHDEYSRKNGGWKEEEGARQAFAILAHKSSELIVEEQQKVWLPKED